MLLLLNANEGDDCLLLRSGRKASASDRCLNPVGSMGKEHI
jgi:hypothetical protein